MKRWMTMFLLALCLLCMGGWEDAEAAGQETDSRYKEELTRPTGTNWGFPGYRAEYEVSDPEIAEILKGKNGEDG